MINGVKALTSAIKKTFGPLVKFKRCQIYKCRNVRGCLHEDMKALLKEAWSLGDAKVAVRTLGRLASSLKADQAGAAASEMGPNICGRDATCR